MVPPTNCRHHGRAGPGLFPATGLFVADCMFWQLDVAASHAGKSMYMLPGVALLGSFWAGMEALADVTGLLYYPPASANSASLLYVLTDALQAANRQYPCCPPVVGAQQHGAEH